MLLQKTPCVREISDKRGPALARKFITGTRVSKSDNFLNVGATLVCGCESFQLLFYLFQVFYFSISFPCILKLKFPEFTYLLIFTQTYRTYNKQHCLLFVYFAICNRVADIYPKNLNKRVLKETQYRFTSIINSKYGIVEVTHYIT